MRLIALVAALTPTLAAAHPGGHVNPHGPDVALLLALPVAALALALPLRHARRKGRSQ